MGRDLVHGPRDGPPGSIPEMPATRPAVPAVPGVPASTFPGLPALDEYAATLRERADGWAALEVYLCDTEGCPPHRWALARRARAMIAGELAWIAEFRAELGGAS